MTGITWTQDLFADLVAKTASELGMYVKPRDEARDPVVYDWTGADIVSATGDGTGYHLSSPVGTGRSEIVPHWPVTTYSYAYDGSDHVRCTVDCGRGPHAIAADITRKLAPVYRSTLAKIAAHEAEAAADQAARDQLTAEITTLMDGRVHAASHSNNWRTTHLSLSGPGYSGFAVEFSGDGGEMTLGGHNGLRVPAEVGLDILRVWAGWALPGLAAEAEAKAAEQAERYAAIAAREAERAKTPAEKLLDALDLER